jgi:hypothetical protein
MARGGGCVFRLEKTEETIERETKNKSGTVIRERTRKKT